MEILVTGSDGQLGKALQEVLPKRNCFFATREDFDITDRKQVVYQITSVRPAIVIHTAAYTDVDGCEENKELAYRVNVQGTENIALACQKIAATMIYISTDYVFDGRKNTPYNEEDKPNPLSVYGKTKLQGEEIVKKLPKHYIIRTAWLFGAGKNFVQAILKLAPKQEIRVVNDQIGSPTYALDLAKAIYKIIKISNLTFAQRASAAKAESQIYHITNSGQCSWYELAKEIAKLKGLKLKILPISSKKWKKIKPDSAKRPKYSVLATKKINSLGIKMRPWQEALLDYLKTF